MSDEPKVVDIKTRREIAPEFMENDTPEECLAKAVDMATTQGVEFNRCVVILLKDSNDDYMTGICTTGMKAGEIVSLLEVVKHDILMELNGY